MGKGASMKGYIKNLSSGKIKKFQFNPESFNHSRGANYSEIVAPGMSYPMAQFVSGGARVFPVELFMYDKPYTGIIEEYEKFLNEFLPAETNTKFKQPPQLLFAYGKFIKKCVLADLSTSIEEYNKNFEPTVARFTLQLRQVGV